MHCCEYPNFISRREFWKFSAHLATTSEATRTLRFGYWCQCIKCFQNYRLLTKFGYSDQYTKSIQNSRLLIEFGYSGQCTKSIQNSRLLTKFGYLRQCSKSIQNFRLLVWLGYRCFRLLRRVISRYPSDGYYHISVEWRLVDNDNGFWCLWRIRWTVRLIFCKFGNVGIAWSDNLDAQSATTSCVIWAVCLAASIIFARTTISSPAESELPTGHFFPSWPGLITFPGQARKY